MSFAENLSYAILDNLLSVYGTAVQAGIGVAKKIKMLSHSIIRGIAQGALHHCRGDRGVCPRFPDKMPNTDDVSQAAAGCCGDEVIPVPDLPHLPDGDESCNPDQ